VKHIKIVRQTQPKSDPARRPDTFYLRHDRFFTLLGTVIIFFTFIAKEGFSDKLKDSVSSMEAAESLAILRRDIAFGQTNSKPLPNPQPGRNPTRQESLGDIEVWKLEGQSLAELAGYQAMSLPDSDTLVRQAKELLSRFEVIDSTYRKVNVPVKPPHSETHVEWPIQQLYDDAMKAYDNASDFRDQVSITARTLRRERERNYTIWKWASYFLFTLGWLLTFYGQLSDKKGDGIKPLEA